MTTPLDQVDRDWKFGNCYHAALQFLKESEDMRSVGLISTNAQIYLVHGILDPNDANIPHAWIEIDDRVLDNSNNDGINLTKIEYIKKRSAVVVKRFTREEADALLGSLRAEGDGLPIADWSHLSDSIIQSALKSYDKANGVFAKDICFSNPTDTANNEKLID